MFKKYRSRCCYIIYVLFSNKYWIQISGVLWPVSIWMAVWVMHETYITSSSVSWTELGVVVELSWKGCGAPSSGELRKRRPSIMGATKPFPISTYLSAVIPPHLFLGGWGCKKLLVLFGDPIFLHLRATHSNRTIIHCIYWYLFELVLFMGSKCWLAAKLWSGRHNWRVIWIAGVRQRIAKLPQFFLHLNTRASMPLGNNVWRVWWKSVWQLQYSF